MKHLKTYETNNKTLWIYTRISTMSPLIEDMQLFDDEKSAENYFIDDINQKAKDDIYPKPKELKNIIFTVEEAKNYCDENDIVANYSKIINIGKYELSEELKLGRDSNKYNL